MSQLTLLLVSCFAFAVFVTSEGAGLLNRELKPGAKREVSDERLVQDLKTLLVKSKATGEKADAVLDGANGVKKAVGTGRELKGRGNGAARAGLKARRGLGHRARMSPAKRGMTRQAKRGNKATRGDVSARSPYNYNYNYYYDPYYYYYYCEMPCQGLGSEEEHGRCLLDEVKRMKDKLASIVSGSPNLHGMEEINSAVAGLLGMSESQVSDKIKAAILAVLNQNMLDKISETDDAIQKIRCEQDNVLYSLLYGNDINGFYGSYDYYGSGMPSFSDYYSWYYNWDY